MISAVELSTPLARALCVCVPGRAGRFELISQPGCAYQSELGAAPPAPTAACAPHNSGLDISVIHIPPELSCGPGEVAGLCALAGCAGQQRLLELPLGSSSLPFHLLVFPILSDPQGSLGLALERALLVCPVLGGPWSLPRRGRSPGSASPGSASPGAASCAKGSARRRHVLTLLIRSAAPVNWKWMREAGGAARGSYLRPLQPRNPEKIFWSCWVALVCALALGTTTALPACWDHKWGLFFLF